MTAEPAPGTRAAKHLADARRLATGAGIVLLVSLFLPWYQKNALPQGSKTFVSTNVSGFGSFTWVHAALILVAAAVLTLLWMRKTGRRVELPANDGTMIAIAGGWTVVLLIVSLFDRPEATGDNPSTGLQWGLLIAMAGAGAMLAAGLTMRAIEQTAAHDAFDPAEEPTAPVSTPATVADDWSDRPVD